MKKSPSRTTKPAVTDGLPLAVFADTPVATLRSRTGLLSRFWDWLQARKSTRADSRRLRVADTVSLGEKRFVAVVQVAGRDFLVAGGPSNIALLAQLSAKEPFEDVLRTTLTLPSQPSANSARAGKSKQTKRRRAPKPKPEAKPVPTEAPLMSEPLATQFHVPGSFGHVLQKSIKPARKQAAKRKPAAAASQQSDARPEAACNEVASAFDVAEAFRYGLRNRGAANGSAPGKLANQKNGRSETEHTGNWA